MELGYYCSCTGDDPCGSPGIAVEFCVHITHASSVSDTVPISPWNIPMNVSSGDRDQRTKEALGTMGASVFRFLLASAFVFIPFSWDSYKL
ncbi:hypothetical protein Tco_1155059 [Tanacetum coccineum]